MFKMGGNVPKAHGVGITSGLKMKKGGLIPGKVGEPILKKMGPDGNDTGFAHLSVNLDVETLVIQGDCPPQSYSKLLKHVDIEPDVTRSPTSIHTIKIEKVLDELSKLLNRRGGRVVEGARLESV